MSVVFAPRGVTVEEWLAAPATLDGFVEVSEGDLVVRRVGGNPHHYLAGRLARVFEEQWPGCRAVAPGQWALVLAADGTVVTGRVPDVLVDGDAVVEVWSPGNTLAEMNAKRREYRIAGAKVLVEAQVIDDGSVLLEWSVNVGERPERAGGRAPQAVPGGAGLAAALTPDLSAVGSGPKLSA
jgi:hypothetical protein